MIYELIPILILLALLLVAGITLIADASVRVFRSFLVNLRDRRR